MTRQQKQFVGELARLDAAGRFPEILRDGKTVVACECIADHEAQHGQQTPQWRAAYLDAFDIAACEMLAHDQRD